MGKNRSPFNLQINYRFEIKILSLKKKVLVYYYRKEIFSHRFVNIKYILNKN